MYWTDGENLKTHRKFRKFVVILNRFFNLFKNTLRFDFGFLYPLVLPRHMSKNFNLFTARYRLVLA